MPNSICLPIIAEIRRYGIAPGDVVTLAVNGNPGRRIRTVTGIVCAIADHAHHGKIMLFRSRYDDRPPHFEAIPLEGIHEIISHVPGVFDVSTVTVPPLD